MVEFLYEASSTGNLYSSSTLVPVYSIPSTTPVFGITKHRCGTRNNNNTFFTIPNWHGKKCTITSVIFVF